MKRFCAIGPTLVEYRHFSWMMFIRGYVNTVKASKHIKVPQVFGVIFYDLKFMGIDFISMKTWGTYLGIDLISMKNIGEII